MFPLNEVESCVKARLDLVVYAHDSTSLTNYEGGMCMRKLSRFVRLGSVVAMVLASAIVVTAIPAGAVTQAQVTAQYASLSNAVQSTEAYAGITENWLSSEQSDVQSEVTALQSGNTPNARTYANSVDADANNVSNYLSSTLGWMNSAQYEYQLLCSEAWGTGAGYLYARAEMPEAKVIYDDAMLAYNQAEGAAASASSLPQSNLGAWGLVCLGVTVIGTAGAFFAGGLSGAAAVTVSRAIALSGVGCFIFGE